MSNKLILLLLILVITAFSCSSPNENDIPLVSPANSTPIVTGIYITSSYGPDVVGVWGNPSDYYVPSKGGNLQKTFSRGSIPKDFSFLHPYPNPSTGSFVMNFTLSEKAIVDMWIMRARWIKDKNSDVLSSGGALVVTTQRIVERELIRNDTLTAGSYNVQWDGRNQNGDFSSGGFYRIYFRTKDIAYWHDIFLYREGLTNLPAGMDQYLSYY